MSHRYGYDAGPSRSNPYGSGRESFDGRHPPRPGSSTLNAPYDSRGARPNEDRDRAREPGNTDRLRLMLLEYGITEFGDPRSEGNSRGSRGLGDHRAGGRRFSQEDTGFADDAPRREDAFPGLGPQRHPHPGYAGFGANDEVERWDTYVPDFPGNAMDPELLHGAVANDQDMDDIISRLMAAGPGRAEGPPPASQNAIANLQKRKVVRDMLDADGKASCSVCMEDVKVDEEVTELPCDHWFHGRCIGEWLSSHGTCPHCRRDISSNAGPPRRTVPVSRDPVRPDLDDGDDDDDRFTPRRDEGPGRRTQRLPGSNVLDNEAYARRLQERYRQSVENEEMLARRLQQEYRASVDGDEELARRLQEDNRPSTDHDEELARRFHEENRPSTDDDEALARRLQEEEERASGYP